MKQHKWQQREQAIQRLLLTDKRLRSLWAAAPGAVVIAAARTWQASSKSLQEWRGERYFLMVVMIMPRVELTRSLVWASTRQVFMRLFESRLLDGLVALEIRYKASRGGRLGEDIFRVCAETPVIPDMARLEASAFDQFEPLPGVKCRWYSKSIPL